MTISKHKGYSDAVSVLNRIGTDAAAQDAIIAAAQQKIAELQNKQFGGDALADYLAADVSEREGSELANAREAMRTALARRDLARNAQWQATQNVERARSEASIAYWRGKGESYAAIKVATAAALKSLAESYELAYAAIKDARAAGYSGDQFFTANGDPGLYLPRGYTYEDFRDELKRLAR